MQVAIQVVWWIGLLVVLAMTVVVLKRVFGLLNVLSSILTLAEYTQAAAEGIARNVGAAERLSTLGAPASQLPESARRLAEAAAEMAVQLGVSKVERVSDGR
jgi:hypothetical protein